MLTSGEKAWHRTSAHHKRSKTLFDPQEQRPFQNRVGTFIVHPTSNPQAPSPRNSVISSRASTSSLHQNTYLHVLETRAKILTSLLHSRIFLLCKV
ncbi:hypothetical protein AVEN_190293-1 [Araneus ventricosus]|uniref:Uncharacterized protein n=1 Tax=Araneus ventricosus TaxID=182803 RepID=A0A4Y2PUS0_ARAVE|nr:hypothetical protein AVEN_190293-1 [Araneus ventricosus]